MPDGFVAMRAWLQRRIEPVGAAPDPGLENETEILVEPCVETAEEDDVNAAIDEARRFRAALADAVDACAQELLPDIAADVLARELLLGPCDLRAIVTSAVARYGVDPVRLRVRLEDAHLVQAIDVPFVIDEELRTGDVVIETHQGSIDASLGVRLDRLLARLGA